MPAVRGGGHQRLDRPQTTACGPQSGPSARTTAPPPPSRAQLVTCSAHTPASPSPPAATTARACAPTAWRCRPRRFSGRWGSRFGGGSKPPLCSRQGGVHFAAPPMNTDSSTNQSPIATHFSLLLQAPLHDTFKSTRSVQFRSLQPTTPSHQPTPSQTHLPMYPHPPTPPTHPRCCSTTLCRSRASRTPLPS